MELNTIYNESNLDTMARMPDNFLHCVVTSPPYWGLRDYGTAGTHWPAVSYQPMPGLPEIHVPEMTAQLGLEETPEAFVGHIVHIFRQVYRVLREDGTCWLNFGDSYAGNGGQYGDEKSTLGGRKQNGTQGAERFEKLGLCVPPKNLLGIPWRVAFALQADGWYLRSDIIWAKLNPMPESVTDRPTKAHEYLFLLAKSSRYYYDAEAVKEKGNEKPHGPGYATTLADRRDRGPDNESNGRNWGNQGTRNRRSVWTIAAQGYEGAHFAVFPAALVKPCILAGSPEKVCSQCGAGYVREVEREPMKIKKSERGAAMGEYGRTASSGTMPEPARSKTTGWLPACTCNAGQARSIVYDPFGGSGTTAEVAHQYGRDWIISEISEEYVNNCARPRLESTRQQVLF